MKFRPHVVLALSLALASARAGELIQSASSSANPLQYLGSGARPTALGSAFTAVDGDLSSLYFNPAGLGTLKGSHAGIHHHSWLGGITQETLAFGIGGRALSFGLSGDLINYGEFEGTDENGNPTAPFTPMDLTLGIDLAKSFDSGVAVGVRLRSTQQNIKDAGQLSSAGDVGVLWKSHESPVSLGLTYSNFGPTVNGFAPSAAFRLGLAYDLKFTPEYGVLFLASGSGLNNGGEQLQTGAEITLSKNVQARAGYQASFMDEQYGGLGGLSAGLGVKLGVFSLDYAYLPYGRIGNSHRVTLNIDFFSGSEPSPAVTQASQPKPAPAPQYQAPQPVKKADSVDVIFEVPANQPIPEEARLKAVTEAHPDDAKAWHDLGTYYFGKKDKAKMLPAFEKALQLQPNNVALKKWLDKVKVGE